MFRAGWIVFALGLALRSAVAAPAVTSPQGAVKAVLELNQQFYYAGDPFRVRISITNDGDQEVANPIRSALLKAFDVRSAGGAALKAEGKADAKEPSRPEKIAAKTFYGATVDLAQLFPDLRKPGTYEVRWSADGVSSDTLVVKMIPKYDPAKQYVARVDTDEGAFVIDFEKTAPLATKAFIDMANAGFYDGLKFHKVRPDWFIEGGDPKGDGSGAPPFRYPMDPTSKPVLKGTVLMKPVSPSPPTNGCQFVIALRPEPGWMGQATVLGQVVEGVEVVQKISRVPSTEQNAVPFFKPLKDIQIRKITVSEKPAAGNAEAVTTGRENQPAPRKSDNKSP